MNQNEFNENAIVLMKYIQTLFPNGCDDFRCSDACAFNAVDGMCQMMCSSNEWVTINE